MAATATGCGSIAADSTSGAVPTAAARSSRSRRSRAMTSLASGPGQPPGHRSGSRHCCHHLRSCRKAVPRQSTIPGAERRCGAARVWLTCDAPIRLGSTAGRMPSAHPVRARRISEAEITRGWFACRCASTRRIPGQRMAAALPRRTRPGMFRLTVDHDRRGSSILLPPGIDCEKDRRREAKQRP